MVVLVATTCAGGAGGVTVTASSRDGGCVRYLLLFNKVVDFHGYADRFNVLLPLREVVTSRELGAFPLHDG